MNRKQKHTTDLQSAIKFKSKAARFWLLLPALLLFVGIIFGFGWLFGNSVAESAGQIDVAETAVFLTPTNPLAHAKIASSKSSSLSTTDLAESVSEFEIAAALSPHDWRYWLALAQMRERVGNAEGAEQAANRAAELAPRHAQVLWITGNILLRHGTNNAAAFAAMRRAAEGDASFAPHFINAVAQTLKTDDLSVLKQIIGNAGEVRAALAVFLAQDKKFDAALAIWRELPETEKNKISTDLSAKLLTAKKYRAAVEIFGESAEVEKPAVGKILNAGFESEAVNTIPFAWQIVEAPMPQISFDQTAKHGGLRSLIISFNSTTGAEFRGVSQIVAVEPNSQYQFEVFARTGNLKTTGTVFWEIVETAGGNILAKTQGVSAGDSDWQKFAVNFTTDGATEAITIRLVRVACTVQPCAISGKIWFDDFSLTKIGEH